VEASPAVKGRGKSSRQTSIGSRMSHGGRAGGEGGPRLSQKSGRAWNQRSPHHPPRFKLQFPQSRHPIPVFRYSECRVWCSLIVYRCSMRCVLRGTRPSTLRNWGVECEITELRTIDRHLAEWFQCLLELINPEKWFQVIYPTLSQKQSGSDRVVP